jgi:hypothetical protein
MQEYQYWTYWYAVQQTLTGTRGRTIAQEGCTCICAHWVTRIVEEWRQSGAAATSRRRAYTCRHWLHEGGGHVRLRLNNSDSRRVLRTLEFPLQENLKYVFAPLRLSISQVPTCKQSN